MLERILQTFTDFGFWTGVLASVTAALIVAGAGYIIRIIIPSAREWLVKRRATRAILYHQLASSDPATRYEANLRTLFNVIQWLIVAGIFYALPEILTLEFILAVPFKATSALFLILSLRWVAFYKNLPSMPTEGLMAMLVSKRWRLHFNPSKYSRSDSHSRSRSKVITFNENGNIGSGRNDNEHTWRLNQRKLELLQKDGRVHSRFEFDPRSGNFAHTNDADTLSIRHQFITPEN